MSTRMGVAAPSERRAELERRYPEWVPRAIHEWFETVADESPSRDFVVTDDRTISYEEMSRWVEEVAAGLMASGVGFGDHVAVLMANHPEIIALKYALSKVGAVFVPLNYGSSADDISYILRQSESTFLVTMSEYKGTDYLAMLDRIAPGWDSGQLPCSDLPALQSVIQLDTGGTLRAGAARFEDLSQHGSRLPPDSRRAGPDDISIIFYTSGTTGRPKGVMWTHDQDARVGFGGALSRAFGTHWRVLSALPLFHAFANNEVLNAAMFAHGAVIPRLSFDPDDIFTSIERHQPNELVTVPTMIVALCEESRSAPSHDGSLVGLMCAGATAPVWLWERAIALLGVREVTTGYGMTETGGGQVMSRPENGVDHVASTVGRIKYAGVAGLLDRGGLVAEMRVVDPTTGEELPEGSAGELISRGPTNARGYWNKPEETAETFRNGWVHTGDLGKMLPGDVVVLTGRKKELIRSGGENYAPKEVEDLLTSHPAISQAFVVGVPDVKWGEIGCAWLVLRDGFEVSEEEINALCRENLAGFKRPRQVRFISSELLPRTPTGKIQKFKLSAMADTNA